MLILYRFNKTGYTKLHEMMSLDSEFVSMPIQGSIGQLEDISFFPFSCGVYTILVALQNDGYKLIILIYIYIYNRVYPSFY